MSEEIKTQNGQKNTVATVGMWFSIIGLVLLITWFWLPLLLIWLILWIIGLFYKPRGKARVAVIIPVIVGIAAIMWFMYVKNSIQTPATEFATRFEEINNNEIYSDIVKEEAFWDLVSSEFKELALSDKDKLTNLYDASTGSNAIEKWSYVFFGLMKESIENSLEKYWAEPVALDTDDENIDEEEIDEEEIDEENDENIDEEDIENNDEEETEDEVVEILDNEEENDIEEIINTLE